MSYIDKWEPVSSTQGMTEEEAFTLFSLVAAVLQYDVKSASAVGYADDAKTATTHVFNVAFVDDILIGSVYEHPGRVIIVKWKKDGSPSTPAPDDEKVGNFESLLANLGKTAND
jgi:hypothetical protein